MAKKTKRKPKGTTKAAPKRAARKASKPAARLKAKPAKAKRKGGARPAKAAKARKPARSRPARAAAATAMPEKVALSRVTAALKRATWAADWVAAQGRFIWHDLMTTDAPTARSFYTELFGWGVQELNMAESTVLLLKNGDRSIGTIMPEASLPSSHWMPYVAVDDVDAACRRAVELGGAVGVPATNVPKLGRLAVVTDPQGGAFSPIKRPPDAGPPPDPAGVQAGDFCWEELATSDAEGAAAFYGALFNWQIEAMPMSLPYWTAKNDGLPVAGITPATDPAGRPSWLPYIAVADVDDTAARAAALGATVVTGATDIPGLGRFAILTDPVGASFALYRAATP
jgi:predicted enzyme related to lactoylglutathione lyase